MRAWLIRHGESESNAGLATNGPGMSPLTPTGRRQAERVAGAFSRPPALIVTSPFVRARQTAEPTIARFPQVPLEEWPVQEFTYLGDLHGPATTAEQRRPHAMAYWDRCDPDYVNGGEGESFAGLVGRVGDLLAGLAATDAGGLVAVFTHGLFVRALIWAVARGVYATEGPSRVDAELMRGFRVFCDGFVLPNGSIVEIGSGADGRPCVVGGGIAHLPADLVTGI